MTKKTHRVFTPVARKRILLSVGIPVGAFFLLNYVVLPVYVKHGGTLNVPKVIGLPVERARQVLDSTGLEPVQADTRPDPRMPVGVVVNQNPPEGSVVKPGRRVYLSVSVGEMLVTVPSLRGRTTRDAKFTLERNGLELGGIGYDTSAAYPENTIIRQSVAADSKLPKGAAVSVVVSRGTLLQEVRVPVLMGRTVTEAERVLAASGLKLGQVTYQQSFDLLPNTIVDQFPRAGDLVPQGQAVELFVVKAGRPAEEIRIPRN